jgi:dUTP pyrophosphatase
MNILKFKKLHPHAKIYKPSLADDAGYDVCSIENKCIEPHSSNIVRTGIALEIPKKYFILIRTRSGYGIKNNIQLHNGLLDSGYRGEITIKLYNHGNEVYYVYAGDKIAQLVLFPRIVIPLIQQRTLSKSQRGKNGLGSTGR